MNDSPSRAPDTDVPAYSVLAPAGVSPFLFVCDHASLRVPASYGDMGLTAAELSSHIAWDPGALAVCEALSGLLDATVVASTVSRLVIDCNRRLDASNLFWTLSETTRIAVNEGLSEDERARRIELYYRPFHDAIDRVIEARKARGQETILVCMHSFTPVFKGVERPWPVGLIHGKDAGFTKALFDVLKATEPDLNAGWNEPYAAIDGVTFTLEHHGEARGLQSTMIEIRNSEILDAAGVAAWATRLAEGLKTARAARVATAGRG